MPHDPSLDQAVFHAYRAHGSAAAAARELGIGERRAQRAIRRLARQGAFADRAPMPGFEIARQSETTNAAGVVVRRSTRMVPEREDTEAPEGMRLQGMSILEDEDGRGVMTWRKYGKADLKRAETLEEVRAAFADIPPAVVETGSKAPSLEVLPFPAEELWTAYVYPDLHYGMLAQGRETGESFDLAIADREYREAADLLSALTPASACSTVLFLGDTFHTNSQTPWTPRSAHLLDIDGRWRKVLRHGCLFACYALELAARSHEDVEGVVLPGNHDPDAARALDVALELRYGATGGRVRIPGTWSEHYFRRWGAVLVGATHGHNVKPAQMATMLAEERPEDWGASRHRHFLFGHIHHETAKRIGSVRVESLGAPVPRSSYEAAAGFASRRTLTAITYHRELGEIVRHSVPIGRLAQPFE